MSNGKFEIFKGRNNQYYFRLKAGNGEIIGSSEDYLSKQSAINGISSVKANASIDARYNVFIGADNRYYFHLKAANGEKSCNRKDIPRDQRLSMVCALSN